MKNVTKKGFTLIEIMVVVLIIGILASLLLQYYFYTVEDAREARAMEDCEMLAKAIHRFNSMEEDSIEYLSELKANYIYNLNELRDPWGQEYQLNLSQGIVYSKGPDQQHYPKNKDHWKNKDNIAVSCEPPLMLVKAEIEYDFYGLDDYTMEFHVLHLHFNKKVKVKFGDTGVFGVYIDSNGKIIKRNGLWFSPYKVSVPDNHKGFVPSPGVLAGKTPDYCAERGLVFRWAEDSPTNYIGRKKFFRVEDVDETEHPAFWSKNYNKWRDMTAYFGDKSPYSVWDENFNNFEDGGFPTARVYHTEGSREIIITTPIRGKRPPYIIAGKHYINLTGNKANKAGKGNPMFFEFDGVTPAVMSGKAVPIEVYEE